MPKQTTSRSYKLLLIDMHNYVSESPLSDLSIRYRIEVDSACYSGEFYGTEKEHHPCFKHGCLRAKTGKNQQENRKQVKAFYI